MLTACLLLTAIGLLGAFDVAYFHHYRCKLGSRAESRREVWLHVLRGFAYAAQFALVPNLRLHGAWYAALVGFFVFDAAVALADVIEEGRSRRTQGGVPTGEYAMHLILSVLVGGYLHALLSHSGSWMHAPTAVQWVSAPEVPESLRWLLFAMAAGSALVALLEVGQLLRPAPVHVKVHIRTSVEALWAVTQDHHEHPNWDHRFDRIIMLSPRIEAGTTMRYEKTLFGITLTGHGRYKHHRPMRQSTFEFWSDDRWSLIRRGVGLWLYRGLPDGLVELSTSYTYEVRWGWLGQVIDALVFRPWIQRETERSFRRLVHRHYPNQQARVAGRAGRKPAPLPRPSSQRAWAPSPS